MHLQTTAGCLAVALLLQLPFFSCMASSIHSVSPPLTNDPQEAYEISRQAYLLLAPAVDNWFYFALATGLPSRPNHVGFDTFSHEDSPIAPNDNVIYSQAWLDLRQEPRIVTVPSIQGRYYSLQIIDGYTHNMGIISERTIGRNGGRFLVSGPDDCSKPYPSGCPPPQKSFCSEGDFVLLLIRMQFDDQTDIDINIPPIQQQFNIERVSTFCNVRGPDPYPDPVPFFISRLDLETLTFFEYSNMILLNLTIHPTEVGLFQEFAKIGIIPGQLYPPLGLSDAVLEAIQNGINDASAQILEEIENPSTGDERNRWQVVIDPPQFGTREVMQGRYLTRAASARAGVYGLDREEAFYPNTRRTATGLPLNAGNNASYYIHFSQDQMPPVFGLDPTKPDERTGFWSLTMYNAIGQFVENPLNRNSIGSRDLGTLCRYSDGSFPIIMQAEEPTERGFRRNWLPTPNGLFLLIARLYQPKPIAISEPYLPPGVQRGLPRVPIHCPKLY